MLLVQDQYVQNSRKNYDTELQLKQNTSKQVHSDSKDIWKIESGCEELNSSGNDTEGEDNFLYPDPSDLPEEVFTNRKPINPRKKNVRFGGPDYSYVHDTSETSSIDNEYPPGIDCGYLETGHRRTTKQDAEVITHKYKDTLRMTHKYKWRMPDCGYDKLRAKPSPEKIPNYLEGMERRAIGLPDYDLHRMRRKDHRCGYHHGDFGFDDVAYKKSIHRTHKYGCGDDITARCCDHCPNELRPQKTNFVKMKPITAASHKHMYHMMKDPESEIKAHRKHRLESFCDLPYHTGSDCYCPEDYYDHGYVSKTKKKTLEAVQEQHEQFSDSTYKIPCSKFSSQTIPGEMSGFPQKRSSEKFANSSQSDWLYYNGKANGSLGDRFAPQRIHKLRSRRTRMNRIKNGWKKAFVQTVRDGCRNEQVGVIVMGSKGPEFYSKNLEKPSGFVPFRRSKSFLDGAAKSFEVMTVDCKNVFLSSSEPGPRTNYPINDLVCPEDDEKVEEKIAKFSKNVNDIVKNSEEKFYKSLSTSEFPEKKSPEVTFPEPGEESREGKKEEKAGDVLKTKYPQFHLLAMDHLSPRVSKSLKKPEKKISEDSKAMADALNEQAKQYLESQSNLKDKEDTFLKELNEKYTPKELNQETVEANLSFWGMKLSDISDVNEQKEAEVETPKNDVAEKPEEKDVARKTELSPTGLVKPTEQISLTKQRRKKYYESAGSATKVEDRGDAPSSQPNSNVGTPKTPKRVGKIKKWDSPNSLLQRQQLSKDGGDTSQISDLVVSFRHLVENGCAISQEESENLQSIFNHAPYNPEMCSNEMMSTTSSEVINSNRESKIRESSPRTPKTLTSLEDNKECKEEEGNKKEMRGYYVDEAKECETSKGEDFFNEVNSRKVMKMSDLEDKICSKSKHKEEKSKKKTVLEDRMKLLRQALPSITAENEATHLKQLKKYIDRFIDRVEASTASEFCNRKDNCHKTKDTSSTDSSEIRVDARKILEFVSNPFKKISSDVTVNIAKKLTDALVQDKSTRCPRHFPASSRPRKHSENETDEEGFVPCEPSSGSGKLALQVAVPLLQSFGFSTAFTYGFLFFCSILFIVKKYK